MYLINKDGMKIFNYKWITYIHIIYIMLLAVNIQSQVIKENDPDLNKIDVIEHSGEFIPFDLKFTDDKGKSVTLGDYFNNGKPVIMILGYYQCPMLCNLVFNGLVKTARELKWSPGKEYQIVTVSINPNESWEMARDKKQNYLAALDKPSADSGWSFLVGSEENSKKLADALGFQYFYVEDQDQYAHPAVVFLLTEKGKISRYLYGIEHNQMDLKFAIQEASEGKVGSTFEKLILYCFHYDPDAKGYVVIAGNIMKLGGLFTMIILAIAVTTMLRRERFKKKKRTIPSVG